MSFLQLLRALARKAMTDPAFVWESLRNRLRNDRLGLWLRVSDTLPPAVKRRLYPPLIMGTGWVLRRRPLNTSAVCVQVLGLWEIGREDEALEVASSRPSEDRPATRLALARFCIDARRPDVAVRLVEGLPGDNWYTLRVQGQALARAGHLSDGLALLDEAVARRPGDAWLVAAREQVAGTLTALRANTSPWTSPVREPLTRKPGRIMHLVNNCLPYLQAGYTVRTQQTALAQQAKGLDPHFVTQLGFPITKGFFDAPAHRQFDGVPYHHLLDGSTTGTPDDQLIARGAQACEPLVQTLGPAALHPTTPHPNGQVALALRDRFDLPIVYEVRGFLEETWLSRQPPHERAELQHCEFYCLSKQKETAIMRAADRLVTLGEMMKRTLVDRGIPADKIEVIPNAVDPDTFRVEGRGRHVRDGLGIAAKSVVLGYISSLVAYEGIDTLLAAAERLRERRYDVHVLIVGDGAARMALERLAAERGLSRHSTFTGRVPHSHVPAYYEAIDIFVVPRKDDRVCRLVTPLKPVEAMAMERAIVVSALPALLELIDDERGRSFAPDDAEDLADALEGLVTDASLRASLGQAAAEWVRRERTWDRNGARYRRLYEDLAAA